MSPEAYEALMRRLESVLNERWTPVRQDADSFAFRWVAGHIPLNCYVQINPKMRAILFRAINPLPVPARKRPLVAEYIQRVNYNLPVGSWAIDLDDGEVRFKNGLYFLDGDLTETLIRGLIESSLFFVYYEIMGVVHLQTDGTRVSDALALRGKNDVIGKCEGMRVAGAPPDGVWC